MLALWRCRHGLVVVRYGGLGDVLCLLPALAQWRREHPGAALALITSASWVPLIQQAAVVDVVVSSQTRGLSWITRWLPVKQVVLPDEQVPAMARQMIPLAEEMSRALGLQQPAAPLPMLQAPSSVRSALKGRLTPSQCIVIHSGPTWEVKQWPADHWQALVSALQAATGLRVIQIGQRGHDANATQPVPLVPGAEDWTARLSLLEILFLLNGCRLFIGIDSGLLHLAGVAGAPLVGLFGPTAPSCFLPVRSQVDGCCADISCAGCHHHDDGPRHWRTGCPNEIQCMDQLLPSRVLERCLQMLDCA